MKFFRAWLTLLLMVCSLPISSMATTCRFHWADVTTYTDGTEVIGDVQYHVWYQPMGRPPLPPRKMLVTTDRHTVQIADCKEGKYWFTAFQDVPNTKESDFGKATIVPRLAVPTEVTRSE
jgi:hypothetical protein